MELFKIHGGARLEGRKSLTAHKPTQIAPIPPLLHIPVQQHVGEPAEPIVHVGDHVRKGQLIAASKKKISAPIHASTSGKIARIGDYKAPHPSGLPVLTITLEPDGKDEWTDLPPPIDLEKATSDEISARVSDAGVVGMGGAAFPAAVKLNLGQRSKLETLIINGAECEPYLTCDDRLMQERPEKIVLGIKAMMQALRVQKSLVAIEGNKPHAVAAMSRECAKEIGIEVVEVPARYPMGSAKHLVQALTGKETPAKSRIADLGVLVHNVGTAYAVYEALYLGRPLISRIVTVSGHVIKNPGNFEVLIGTPISYLIDLCGGMTSKPDELFMGGPMMGIPLPDLDVPVVKGTLGVLALKAEKMHTQPVMPCISCGSCVIVCPAGLTPLEMASRIKHDDVEGAAKIGLNDCISCGSCNYVCPSHIPLVQYFNYGKGFLAERAKEKRNQERMKTLAERRSKRDEERRKELEKKHEEAKRHHAESIPQSDLESAT